MAEKITLGGVANIIAINSPSYFRDLSREAYSIFQNDASLGYAFKIMTSKNTDELKDLPLEVQKKAYDLITKYTLTGGTVTKSFDCKLTFSPKEKMNLDGIALAEIKLKDGIIVSIDKAKNKFKTI